MQPRDVNVKSESAHPRSRTRRKLRKQNPQGVGADLQLNRYFSGRLAVQLVVLAGRSHHLQPLGVEMHDVLELHVKSTRHPEEVAEVVEPTASLKHDHVQHRFFETGLGRDNVTAPVAPNVPGHDPCSHDLFAIHENLQRGERIAGEQSETHSQKANVPIRFLNPASRR